MSTNGYPGATSEVYVSGMLADKIVIDNGVGRATGIGPAFVEVKAGVPYVSLDKMAFVVLYFRKPRPGGHVVRFVLRDGKDAERMEFPKLPPYEHTGENYVTAQRAALKAKIPPMQDLRICVEVNGKDYCAWPIILTEHGKPIGWTDG